jgi:hypothetical protein
MLLINDEKQKPSIWKTLYIPNFLITNPENNITDNENSLVNGLPIGVCLLNL